MRQRLHCVLTSILELLRIDCQMVQAKLASSDSYVNKLKAKINEDLSAQTLIFDVVILFLDVFGWFSIPKLHFKLSQFIAKSCYRKPIRHYEICLNVPFVSNIWVCHFFSYFLPLRYILWMLKDEREIVVLLFNIISVCDVFVTYCQSWSFAMNLIIAIEHRAILYSKPWRNAFFYTKHFFLWNRFLLCLCAQVSVSSCSY